MGKKGGVSPSCGDIWIDGDFLLGGLAIAGLAAAFLLNQAIMDAKKKRRRKRREAPRLLKLGLEEFEDKIDKIAGGNNEEANGSWIGQLYQKFKGSFLDGEELSGNDIEGMDGLEPPILDDTWGLDDVHKLFEDKNNNGTVIASANNGTETAPATKAKRSLSYGEEAEKEDASLAGFDEEEEDEYTKSLVGEAKCKSKFWRCISKVVKGGLHYVDAPGGLSGAFQKTMFRMAFHGGFGNVWNALMTIPEARNAKRCMNAQDSCLAFEAIRAEAGATENDKPRLIVNPDFVENIDESDGKTQFNEEDQAKFDNEI